MNTITRAPALRSSAETKRLKTTVFRYGIGVGAFALTMFVAGILRYLAISIDLTIIVVGALICAAWYGGRDPGVLVAILFEHCRRGTPRFRYCPVNMYILLCSWPR